MDFAGANNVAPLSIGTWTSGYTNTDELRAIALASGSALTWVANLAVYVPFSIPFWFPVRRVWWYNGSTITTSNADVGVFSLDGEKLVSAGSTALAGASAIQYVTPASEVWLPPDAYYFGYVGSGTTARTQGTSTYTAANLRGAGVLQEAVGSSTLPSRMTPTAIANALFPYCGMSQTASGF